MTPYATSIYLARLIGPVFVIIGAGILIDGSTTLLAFAVALTLLGGVAIVLVHNVWTADWRVLITFVGWFAIVDSATRILAPVQMAEIWTPLSASWLYAPVHGVAMLIIGAVLCWFGFFAKSSVTSGKGR